MAYFKNLYVFTLPFTFNSFAAAACIEAMFLVLRGALLACLDLDFMMWSTMAGMILYVPAIVLAMKVFAGRAIAIFMSMYVPQAFLCVAFLIRLEVLIRRMIRKEDEEEKGRKQEAPPALETEEP